MPEQLPNDQDVITAIEDLRIQEGESLLILCDNPEATSRDTQAAVEIMAGWTGWQSRRFYGESWKKAVIVAAEAKATATAIKPRKRKAVSG